MIIALRPDYVFAYTDPAATACSAKAADAQHVQYCTVDDIKVEKAACRPGQKTK